MNRFAPGILLIVVTALFLGYGSSKWSWLAGPVAALALWALALKTREPAVPRACARARAGGLNRPGPDEPASAKRSYAAKAVLLPVAPV